MNNTTWEEFKELFESKLNLPGIVADYIAVHGILHKCVSGLSNKTISRYEKLTTDYIESVIKEFLDFGGWDNDLDINTWFIYRSTDSEMSFRSKINTLTNLLEYDIITIAYGICKKYDYIKRELEKYYDIS